SGQLYWETSADGLTWTTQTSIAAPFAVSAVRVNLNAGTWDAVGNPGMAVFDNLDIPSPAVSPTPTVTSVAAPTASPTAIADGGIGDEFYFEEATNTSSSGTYNWGYRSAATGLWSPPAKVTSADRLAYYMLSPDPSSRQLHVVALADRLWSEAG